MLNCFRIKATQRVEVELLKPWNVACRVLQGITYKSRPEYGTEFTKYTLRTIIADRSPDMSGNIIVVDCTVDILVCLGTRATAPSEHE